MLQAKRALLLPLLLPLLLTACAGDGEAPAPRDAATAQASGSAEPALADALPRDPGVHLGDPALSIGEPAAIDNLIVWPVRRAAVAAPPTEPVAYLTLDAALAAGLAEVRETGQVSELAIVNRSDKPLLLLAGEVLDGGQQDRIVARDQLVDAGASAPLASFCVEQSRWSVEAGDPQAGERFRADNGVVANRVRAAAQVAKSQGAVWANVGQLAAANAATTATGTYMAVLQKDTVQADVERVSRAVLPALTGDDIVGFVAAVDWGEASEMVAAEVFGSPALFWPYRERLLRSYAVDAISSGRSAVAESAQVSGEQQLGLGYVAFDELGYVDLPSASITLQQALEHSDSAGVVAGQPSPASFFVEHGARNAAQVDASLALAQSRPNDPDLVVGEGRIEAGNADMKHLHRTIYKQP